MIKAEVLKDNVKFRRVIGTEPYLTDRMEMDIKDVWGTFTMTKEEYLEDRDYSDKLIDTWNNNERSFCDDDGDYEPSYWF